MSFYLFLAIASTLLAVMVSTSDLRTNEECMAPEECGDSLLAHSKMLSSQRMLAREELEQKAMQHLANTHKPTAGLVVSLRQLATELAARQENCSEVFNDTLAPVMNQTTIVIDAELGQVVDNQRRVNESYARVLNCNAHLSAGSSAAGSLGVARQTHATCRSDQKVLGESKNTLCSDFETYQNSLSYPSCIYPQGTAVTAQCMQTLANFVKGHNATFFQKQLACNTATENLRVKQEACDVEQRSFEMASCVAAERGDDFGHYISCFQQESASYNQVKQDVQAQEATSKAEYASAVQTQCLLNVLVQGSQSVLIQAGELNQCNDVDTSMLDITYPILPEIADPPSTVITSRPCDTEWLQDEYENEPWYSGAPTTTCVACPALD